MNLVSVAEEIQHRIIHIFGRDMDGRRATNGGNYKLDFDPHFRDYVWFYEVKNTLSLLCVSSSHSISPLPVLQWRYRQRPRRISPDWMVGLLMAFNITAGSLIFSSGLVLWPTTSYKVELLAAYPGLQGVRFISIARSRNTNVSLAPRSLAHHYFDVRIFEACEYKQCTNWKNIGIN